MIIKTGLTQTSYDQTLLDAEFAAVQSYLCSIAVTALDAYYYDVEFGVPESDLSASLSEAAEDAVEAYQTTFGDDTAAMQAASLEYLGVELIL